MQGLEPQTSLSILYCKYLVVLYFAVLHDLSCVSMILMASYFNLEFWLCNVCGLIERD